jgi:uncharacterized RDD family membrane protein YckC
MKYAGFWRRFWANAIDGILLTIASIAIEYVLLGIYYLIWRQLAQEAVPPFGEAFDGMFLQYLNVAIYFLCAWPYYVLGHFRKGSTWGKRWLRIQVVQLNGSPITYRQSWIRFAGYLPSYLLAGCGFLMAAFQPEKRALHDLMAGTVSVVRERGSQMESSG